MTAAQYLVKEYVIPVTISRRERRMNSGSAGIISMLETKTTQAELQATEGLNDDMLGTNAADALRIVGFQDFMQKLAVGSQTGTIGGIDRATNTWWNNQFGTVSGAFATNGLNRMRTIYYSSSKGHDHPDLIITTQAAYENYERVLEARERYQTVTTTEAGTRIAEAGFDVLKYHNAFMFYDESCLANTMYFLNTRYWNLYVDQESDWAVQPFITPNNQLATTALIVWMGALTCSNLSRQGVLDAVDTF